MSTNLCIGMLVRFDLYSDTPIEGVLGGEVDGGWYIKITKGDCGWHWDCRQESSILKEGDLCWWVPAWKITSLKIKTKLGNDIPYV